MPEAVKRYVELRDLVALKPVYESLLISYIDDVEKYARNPTQAQVIRYAIPACFKEDNKKSPRLQVVDTGLVNYFAGVQKEVFSSNDLTEVYSGRIIEHVVGQEMIANKESLLSDLLFWVREKEGTTSELDFLFLVEGNAIPVEVKSGKTGKLRSLHQYMDRSAAKLAFRLYAGKFREDQIHTLKDSPFTLISLPYYLAGKLKKYADHWL